MALKASRYDLLALLNMNKITFSIQNVLLSLKLENIYK